MKMFDLEKALKRLARFQCRHAFIILVLTIIFTLFMLVGFSRVQLETDIMKEFPQDIKAMKDYNTITEKFGGSSAIMILVQIDKNASTINSVSDIRDPRVIKAIAELDAMLSRESNVKSVQSVGSFFNYAGIGVPQTTDGVKLVLNNIPTSQNYFNRDYTATIIIVSNAAGNSEKQVKDVLSKINENIDSVGMPGSVKVTITGSAPLRSDILNLLVKDTVFTTILAALLILLLIFILESFSVMPTVQIFWPIVVGVIWTYGLMGWLDIPLSIITATVGAMLIGLDVEYGTFMVRRTLEEWEKKKSSEEGVVTAVSAVGRAIIGSGGAMIVGFAVLIMSVMPMMQHLGLVLSLGIFFRLLMAVFINPAIIFIAHDYSEKRGKK
jgi:hydrophobe/amphiphile efflux-3 (HAE3) family protein